MDGGVAPHHRTPSGDGVYGDRSRSRLPDRGDPAHCRCGGLAVRPTTPRSLGWAARRRCRRFVVTAALAGRERVVDLAGRSVRWRVPLRWYLVALFTVPLGATLPSLAI